MVVFSPVKNNTTGICSKTKTKGYLLTIQDVFGLFSRKLQETNEF